MVQARADVEHEGLSAELIVQILASVTTLISMWSYGSKSVYGPLLAIVGQGFWWAIMIQSSLWGLLPLNVAMAFVHIRNLIKWRREATTKWRRDAQREALQAARQQAGAVQGDRAERKSPKAYEVLSGGQLR